MLTDIPDIEKIIKDFWSQLCNIGQQVLLGKPQATKKKRYSCTSAESVGIVENQRDILRFWSQFEDEFWRGKLWIILQ